MHQERKIVTHILFKFNNVHYHFSSSETGLVQVSVPALVDVFDSELCNRPFVSSSVRWHGLCCPHIFAQQFPILAQDTVTAPSKSTSLGSDWKMSGYLVQDVSCSRKLAIYENYVSRQAPMYLEPIHLSSVCKLYVFVRLSDL